MNLLLMAHSEIRGLREAVETIVVPRTGMTIEEFQVFEADCRRRHLEALHLNMADIEPLLSEAQIAEATSAMEQDRVSSAGG